jgi:glycosyltransferase involved in cell wall biosynthesis
MNVVYLNSLKIDAALPAVNFSLCNAYGLAQAGARCTFMAQKRTPAITVAGLLDAFQLPALANLDIRLYPVRRIAGIKSNQWFYLAAYRDIKKMHRAAPIDAVISRDPGALPYLVRLKAATGIKVFYQPHNFYVDLKLQPDINRKNAFRYHLFEKYLIPRLSGLLCLQESQAVWYRKYFPDCTVYATPPGLTSMTTPNPDRFKNRLVGYIGSLQMKKGVEVLLAAFKLLPADCRLVLVGGRDENEVRPVREMAQALGMADRVEITGWLPYTNVLAYLTKITVGVVPLKDTFYNRYLTAPNKLFDYLSAGVPIIAADLPSIRDFITPDQEGLLVKPDDPAALAQVLISLLADAGLYQQLTENAAVKAREYLWKKQAATQLRAMTGRA